MIAFFFGVLACALFFAIRKPVTKLLKPSDTTAAFMHLMSCKEKTKRAQDAALKSRDTWLEARRIEDTAREVWNRAREEERVRKEEDPTRRLMGLSQEIADAADDEPVGETGYRENARQQR